ncbi:NADH dehydrogenase [miscellaneous Crenarchaeota group archaeon SMTZ-80]|nr:MAG: NADH dehydrogenase [miscellaneous Crenarchaeota group archaeon SMTZ-80]
MKKIKNREDLERVRKRIVKKSDPNKPCITISSGTCCRAYGCQKVTKAFITEIEKLGIRDKVEVKTTGCLGFCERGPIVVIYPKGIYYQRVTIEDVSEIVTETILNGKIIDRLLYIDPVSGKKFVNGEEISFYKKQMRVLLKNNWLIDPNKIEDYIINCGYTALSNALFKMTPEQIIDTIKRSGLRGRGGAGFPTGVKWENCRRANGDLKFIVCNADEGDPGAYMDRCILEGNPHSIIEGMIIGAYAIGSHEGYIYVRHEYPLAVKNLKIALNQAREYGLLGNNILNSGFDFNIKISIGGGVFVCGESTALITSIEGKIGEPRAKYIHTVEKGLWNKPTNLNNVETWANIPIIINKGSKWFSAIGTEKSKGTKIFSLVGKINNSGLVEVPMGITLKEIVYEIGGGVLNGKKFKAIQTGGPSGGCIPEKLLGLPVDFEKLKEAGSMMGSGGMIVIDEETCVVDLAKYFLNFILDESCGKCIPCREGTGRLSEIVERITSGKAKIEDLELLEELSHVVKDFSLCGLGQTAPNPVLSTINYFRDEWETHIKNKTCPALVCKELIQYYVDNEKCTGCGVCKNLCPQKAILGELKNPHSIVQDRCISCGICHENCKYNAIILSSPRGKN